MYDRSVPRLWRVEFMCATKFATENVRHARKRANKTVFAVTKPKKEIATVWFGRVKKRATNYSNAEDIDAKLNVTAVIAANAQTDCCDRAHVASK